MFACDCVHKIYTQQLLYKKSTTPWPVHPIRSPQEGGLGCFSSSVTRAFRSLGHRKCCVASARKYVECTLHVFDTNLRGAPREQHVEHFIYTVYDIWAQKKNVLGERGVCSDAHITHTLHSRHTLAPHHIHTSTPLEARGLCIMKGVMFVLGVLGLVYCSIYAFIV